MFHEGDFTNRLSNKFHFYLPVKQAGFCAVYSTIDHRLTLRPLIEKTTESNIPIHIDVIDFHNAFESIEIHNIPNSMDNATITHNIKMTYNAG